MRSQKSIWLWGFLELSMGGGQKSSDVICISYVYEGLMLCRRVSLGHMVQFIITQSWIFFETTVCASVKWN